MWTKKGSGPHDIWVGTASLCASISAQAELCLFIRSSSSGLSNLQKFACLLMASEARMQLRKAAQANAVFELAPCMPRELQGPVVLKPNNVGLVIALHKVDLNLLDWEEKLPTWLLAEPGVLAKITESTQVQVTDELV